MSYVTPIYNRTVNDLDYIKYIHSEIISKGFNNIDSALQTFWMNENSKGCFNIIDLNRIEENISYLSTTLNSYGYTHSITTHVEWVQTDFITVVDIDRIKQNILNIITAYHNYVLNPTLVLDDIYLSFQDINDIEYIIYNTNMLIELMLESFRYSGTFYYSGQDFAL